jgi:hypothetical protein
LFFHLCALCGFVVSKKFKFNHKDHKGHKVKNFRNFIHLCVLCVFVVNLDSDLTTKGTNGTKKKFIIIILETFVHLRAFRVLRGE